MTRDWYMTGTVMLITCAISILTTLYIIDHSDQPQKILVMDFARDLALLMKDKRINDENRDAILADMIKQSERLADQGYVILNRKAVLAAPDSNEYRYYENK